MSFILRTIASKFSDIHAFWGFLVFSVCSFWRPKTGRCTLLWVQRTVSLSLESKRPFGSRAYRDSGGLSVVALLSACELFCSSDESWTIGVSSFSCCHDSRLLCGSWVSSSCPCNSEEAPVVSSPSLLIQSRKRDCRAERVFPAVDVTSALFLVWAFWVPLVFLCGVSSVCSLLRTVVCGAIDLVLWLTGVSGVGGSLRTVRATSTPISLQWKPSEAGGYQRHKGNVCHLFMIKRILTARLSQQVGINPKIFHRYASTNPAGAWYSSSYLASFFWVSLLSASVNGSATCWYGGFSGGVRLSEWAHS